MKMLGEELFLVETLMPHCSTSSEILLFSKFYFEYVFDE